MKKKYSDLVLLILAGELIFSLPFHITRFFKPAVLDTFQITNTNLGDAFALYGILALLCYFPSGYFADKLSPKKLIFCSLLFTGIGGLYYATLPHHKMLPYLYAFWGLTTILFFFRIKKIKIKTYNHGIHFQRMFKKTKIKKTENT